jgi:hypothetical protein
MLSLPSSSCDVVRIAIVPPFSGLRRFEQGRNFKQWTGDDTKALMKVRIQFGFTPESRALCYHQVYLPAIEGYVPPDMLRCLRAFLEFCYIVRHDVITELDIEALREILERFYRYREVFLDEGVCEGLSLPRQHAMSHYIKKIRQFGAPNGLCSSITESKHIRAVKEPWRRTNRYKALLQMLLIIQRLDKLAAMRVDFTERGMLEPSELQEALRMIGKPSDS